MDLADAIAYCRDHHHSILIARKADGSPQPSPVVHGVNADGHLVISSREPAYKVRNLRRDPRVQLCAVRDQFFGPWVVVEGEATIVSLPEAMDGLVDLYRQIAGEHDDWDDYRAAMRRDQRVLITIRPDRAGPDRSG
ncbi:MAG: PPOX class F420-dependent oxidoreductase [Acidimicrobiales bacterium]